MIILNTFFATKYFFNLDDTTKFSEKIAPYRKIKYNSIWNLVSCWKTPDLSDMLSSVPISVMSCLTAWLDSSWIFRICSQYRCMVPRAMDSNHRSATCSGSSKGVTEIMVTGDTPKHSTCTT